MRKFLTKTTSLPEMYNFRTIESWGLILMALWRTAMPLMSMSQTTTLQKQARTKYQHMPMLTTTCQTYMYPTTTKKNDTSNDIEDTNNVVDPFVEDTDILNDGTGPQNLDEEQQPMQNQG